MSRTNHLTRRAHMARQIRAVIRLWADDPLKLQADIAEELHLSDATVSRALDVGMKQWTPECLKDIDELKKKGIARLYDLYQRAIEEYEKSKSPMETTSQKTTIMPGNGGDNGTGKYPIEVTKTTKHGYGDPRLLEAARAIMAEINKILGLNAPEKREHSGTIGVELHDLSDDELERRAADLDRREAMLTDRKAAPPLPE
jgi:DNA-binding Lrp family transcriptional regulator